MVRRVRPALVMMVIAILFLSAPAFAQQTESRVIGKVTDSSGAVLPGVTVTVTSAQNGAVRTTVSEGDGSFIVTNLGAGAYTVTFQLDGFQATQRLSCHSPHAFSSSTMRLICGTLPAFRT